MFFKKRLPQDNNTINVPSDSKIQLIIQGTNNIINVLSHKLHGKIFISGDNNTIDIADSCFDETFSIAIGVDNLRRTNNCYVKIGKDTYCGYANLVLGEDNSRLTIGDNCMLSENINIYVTDGHTIMNLDGDRTNIGKFVEIGNHVWVGLDVKIGKNVKIPDDCIVGWGAIVTKSFNIPNSIIAGNPAKPVKQGVNWVYTFPNVFDKNKNIQPKFRTKSE